MDIYDYFVLDYKSYFSIILHKEENERKRMIGSRY